MRQPGHAGHELPLRRGFGLLGPLELALLRLGKRPLFSQGRELADYRAEARLLCSGHLRVVEGRIAHVLVRGLGSCRLRLPMPFAGSLGMLPAALDDLRALGGR